MENKYFAFISYSRKDIKDAKWIHSSLERFHIPAKLPRPADAEPIPKPLRCFRDINDLDIKSESFVNGIENALLASKYLIVVCSPNSAKSNADGNHYVDWEIKKFVELHGEEYAEKHILPVIIDGEITNNTKENECLPPSLYDFGSDFLQHNFPILNYGEDNTLSKESKNDLILKILSFLLQVKYSILNDRYQKYQKKRRNIVLSISLFLVILFSVISLFAGFGWKRANKNLAYSHYIQANNLMEAGETSYALAYYKKSLQLDENELVKDKVYNLITNNSWLVEQSEVTTIIDKQPTYIEFEEISKKINAYNGYFNKNNIPNVSNLVEISNDRQYAVLLKNSNCLQVINLNNQDVLFEDYIKEGFNYSQSIFAEHFIAYSQNTEIDLFSTNVNYLEDNIEEEFLITIVDLEKHETQTIYEKHGLATWNLSSDGQFLVYSTSIANEVSELSVYDIMKGEVSWTRREKWPRAQIIFSPDCIHFATCGGISYGDKSFSEVLINNCFSSEYNILIPIGEIPEIIKFSDDGRRIAVATSNNKLRIFNTRNGLESVRDRLFDKKIIDITFVNNDNNIQISLFNEKQKQEFSIHVSDINFDIISSNLSPVIVDTISLKDNYICNLLYTNNGNCLEIKNLFNSLDSFSIQLNKDIKDYNSDSFNFIRTNSAENILLVGVGHPIDVSKGGVVEIYSLDINKQECLKYERRINFKYPVKDISVINNTQAIIFSSNNSFEKTDTEICLLNYSEDDSKNIILPFNRCLNYYIENNNLYVINKNEDDKTLLYKWNLNKSKEEWSYELKDINSSSCNLYVDKKQNVYVYSNSNTNIRVIDKDGSEKNTILANNFVKIVVSDTNGDFLAIGTSSKPDNTKAQEVEIITTSDNKSIFKTSYNKNKLVYINKLQFSNNSKLLNVAGANIVREAIGSANGFYDVWDISSGTKIDSDFSVNIDEVFDFNILENGTTLLFTKGSTIIRYLYDTDKRIIQELKDDMVYQIIGGWTLNKNSVPQLLRTEKKHGKLYDWLISSINERKIHPKSSTDLLDALSLWNSKADRDVILDIQADNEDALDDYYFAIVKAKVEEIFKRNRIVNSNKDMLEIDLAWEMEYSNNFWNLVYLSDEAKKIYKVNVESYVKKLPNSKKAINALINYYKRTSGKDVYSKLFDLYPDNLQIKLMKIAFENKSFQDVKRDFNVLKDYIADSNLSDIKLFWDFYKKTVIVHEDSFEIIKQEIDWFLQILRNNLYTEPQDTGLFIFDILTDIDSISVFFPNGNEYYEECINYFIQNLSDKELELIHSIDNLPFSFLNDEYVIPDQQLLEDALERKDLKYIEEKLKDIKIPKFSIKDLIDSSKALKTYNQLLYYYYFLSIINDERKNEILDELLSIDISDNETYSSLTLLSFYRHNKIMDKPNIQESDLNIIIDTALKITLKKYIQGRSVGIKIKDVTPNSQGYNKGLRKGDILLFYDTYLLDQSIYDFFFYDLYDLGKKNRADEVRLMIFRNGEPIVINVMEGDLGIEF